MTIQQAYQHLLQQLYDIYEQREAANIADMVIEKVTGLRKIDRIVYKDISLNAEQRDHLQIIAAELVKHKPVQYAIGEAWFMGMKLFVNEHVLIPRPETEELVDWIVQDFKTGKNDKISVLDIGTGSGCIPIAVKKKLPQAEVSAIDISEDALQVAKRNAVEQNALVDFLFIDILDEVAWNQSGHYDIIVSNPPYIVQSEKNEMRKNVLHYEPHIALFVENDDPLLFYKTIARFSKTHLKKGGNIYVEINEAFGKEVTAIFKHSGFVNVKLRKDMQGKDRMVKGVNG